MRKYMPFFALTLILSWVLWSLLQNRASVPPGDRDTAAVSELSTSTPAAEVLGEKRYSSPPEMLLDPEQTYSVRLVTNFGEIAIELFAQETPIAANNFAFLTKDEFYDGLTFHRVVENFMIQGGDPNGDGTGGPGYQLDDEPVTRDYTRGIVAYANSGPDTSGSQFFIMHADYQLPPQYVIFGQVTEGMDVVDQIATVPVEADQFGEVSKPVNPVVIEKAELVKE